MVKCLKCGTESKEGNYCPECGTKFKVNNYTGTDEKNMPKSKVQKKLKTWEAFSLYILTPIAVFWILNMLTGIFIGIIGAIIGEILIIGYIHQQK